MISHLLYPRLDGGLTDRAALALWSGYGRAVGASRVAAARAFRSRRAAALHHGGRARDVAVPEPGAACDAELFRRHALADVLPFWERHALDTEHGGYRLELDRHGRCVDTRKHAFAQGRMIFAFCLGYELSGDPRLLDYARHGVDFVLSRLWDARNGGFAQALAPETGALDLRKGVVNQAFLLIGLARYYGIERDADVRRTVEETLARLDDRARDREHGGYFETLTADWRVEGHAKSLCVHVGLLTALLSVRRVVPQLVALSTIEDLAVTICARFSDPTSRLPVETLRADWRYDPARTRDQMLVGHALEAAWRVVELYELTEEPSLLRWAADVMDRCIDRAWDASSGGFYQFVYRAGGLANREKLWWTQCEALGALLACHRYTGAHRYLEVFGRLTRFCFARFHDVECGEWFRRVRADGSATDEATGGPTDPKKVGRRAAYHTMGACHECFVRLGGVPVVGTSAA